MNKEFPEISLIIACLNEEKYIAQCLDSLIAQSFPGEIEILISDGGSADGTISIVEGYSNKYNFIRLLSNPKIIQAAGRNLAIMESKFDLVAYLDGHSYADKDWLMNLYNSFDELKSRGVKLAGVGSVHKDAIESEFTKASKAVMNSFLGGSSFSSYSGKSGLQEVDTAYACLYDKTVLIEAGLYDEHFPKGEDLHLNLRITRKLGYKLYVDNHAVTYYYNRSNYHTFARQMFDYGFWRRKVMANLKVYSYAALIPMIFVVFVLIMGVAAFLNLINVKYLLVIIAIYMSINILNSSLLSIKRKIHFLKAIIIQITIHLCYGIGMIYSIFKRN